MTLGEFVKQLAALLQQDEVTMPFKDERPWHELFYELKRDTTLHGKPGFFESLRFDLDGPYPKSRDLSRFLQALHWNASVSATNPHFETISLPAGVAQLWMSRYESTDADSRAVLRITADRARDKFSGVLHAARV